jgi:hypothetical protein
MDVVLRHRGREVSSDDIAFIRGLIERNPAAARRALSIELCKAWGWVQPNGALRDGVCRGLLLALHRAGHIELPPPRLRTSKPPWERVKPAPVEVDATPLETSLSELGPVQLRQVRRTPEEALVNGLVQQHHYLGYRQPVGEHLKYLVTAQERPIACFCWSSAPRHLAPRDQHIGWPPATRQANLGHDDTRRAGRQGYRWRAVVRSCAVLVPKRAIMAVLGSLPRTTLDRRGGPVRQDHGLPQCYPSNGVSP